MLRLRWKIIAGLVACLSLTTSLAAQKYSSSTADTVVLPEAVPDPIEPFNRALFAINKGIIIGAVKPTARIYRFVVVKPVRKGIANVGRNAAYPGRLINNLLQGRWTGARDETDRFLCNTFAGVGGMFDVATKWNIPKSDADFGQTFGQWGWQPKCYLMLPIFGPSNERDAIGFAADTASNPLTYLTPYPFTPTDPLTYFSPYTYHSAVVIYNNLSDSVDSYARFSKTEMDPYSVLHYLWTFGRSSRKPNFELKGPQDEPSLQTLQSVAFTVTDPEFPNRSKTRSVFIPGTRKRLNFTYWLREEKAPVVYIVPGLGSHRLVDMVLGLAELAYGQGFSVVCLSNPYNYEFMEHASTAAMPGYTPTDAKDLHAALTQIDRKLQSLHPNRFGARAIMGYSMGGFLSLFLAATEPEREGSGIKFDRYVAIDTPVRLLHGISKLDAFYDAPLAWPSEERTAALENTFVKVAVLKDKPPTPGVAPPFDAVESRFLVGLAFRFILRDVIFSSQIRYNQGILKHSPYLVRRGPVYEEIMRFSFKDYFDKFTTPYYRTRGIDLAKPETLEPAVNLRAHSTNLQTNSKVRIIVNRNDILLEADDLKWFETTFDPKRLTMFDKGGHLGNLAYPDTQRAIVQALEGLKQ